MLFLCVCVSQDWVWDCEVHPETLFEGQTLQGGQESVVQTSGLQEALSQRGLVLQHLHQFNKSISWKPVCERLTRHLGSKDARKPCWLWTPLVSRGFSSAHLYRHHDSSSDCLSALHPLRLSRLMHVQNSQIWLTSNMLFLGAFTEIINMHIVLKAHESLCLFFLTV